jgi:hypothetical protein
MRRQLVPSEVLSYLVPAALVLVVIARVGRSRGYLLLVPIVYEFGRAAYLDTYGRSFAGLNSEQIGVAILIICALTLSALRPPAKANGLFSFGVLLLGGYALWSLMAAVLSFAGGLGLGKVAFAAVSSMTLPASVAAWLLAFSRVTEEELLGTVRVVVGMTAGLCVLYTLQALGVGTYPYAAWGTVYVQGNFMVRDFLTFPYFAVPLALAWAASARGRVLPRVLTAVLCLTAVAATFTRSILIASAVGLIVAGVVTNWQRGSLKRRRLPVGTLSGVLTLGFATVLALDQFWELRLAQGLSDVNVTARLAAVLNNVRTTSWLDALVGYGYAGTVPVLPGVVLGDSLWISLVYRLGLAGVLLLFGAAAGASIDGVRGSVGSAESRRTLCSIAVALPFAALTLSLAGVPSALHLGFALSLGPALALGLVRESVGFEAAHSDLSTLLPDWLRSPGMRRVLVVGGVVVMLAVEVWAGARLAG